MNSNPIRDFQRLTATLSIVGVASMTALFARADSVTIEAESGTLGGDWAVSDSDNPACIMITSDSTAGSPDSIERVADYSVTFPAAGTFELYARVRVGSGGFDDDSMFYGDGFGPKSPTTSSDRFSPTAR